MRQITSLPRAARAAALLVLTAAPLSLAQPLSSTDIPSDTVQSLNINAAQRGQIDAYVQAYAAALTSDDRADRRRARNAIIQKLNLAGVSIDFRQNYSAALAPYLTELTESDDRKALDGMRIAGELATATAAARITPYLTSDDDGLRYFAVTRIERIFNIIAARTPSISAGQARDLADDVAELLATEPNAETADAAVRALAAASLVNHNNFESFRFAAVTGMAEGASARMAAIDGRLPRDEVLVALRANGAVRDALIDPSVTPTEEACIAAIALGGDIIGRVFELQASGDMPPVGERSLEVQALAAGENAMNAGLSALAEIRGESAPTPTNLANLLQSGDDRGLQNQVLLLLGPNSAIVEEFDFEPKRFVDF